MELHLNYLAFAVPLFMGFMGLEYVISKRQQRNLHQFEESVSSLNMGLAERVTDILTAGLFYFVFNWVYQHYAIFSIQPSVIAWIGLFLLTDFVWYFYHRAGHRVNLFWGVHVVHHQSDDFNYTTSVRITFFQALARGMFWCVIPWVGFPPEMITVFLLLHGAYPFFTHTQVIGKLGVLEYFFVTPSHHRVHHSSNPCYLDKNYGDILIIWDKLFGTFAEEREEPKFGLTKPLQSYSFLWQMFHFPLEMIWAYRRASSWRERMRVFFGKPDDIDPRIRSLLERYFLIHRNHSGTQVDNQFVCFQLVISACLVFFVLLFEHYQTATQLGVASVFILISVINTGALLEQRNWIFYLEYVRLFLFSIYILTWFTNVFTCVVLLIVNASALYFHRRLEQVYYRESVRSIS